MEDPSQQMVKLFGRIINLPLSVSISSLEMALAALREMQKFVVAGSGQMPTGSAAATSSTQSGPGTASGQPAGGAQVSTDLVHDTFNGLSAFVVPGADPYSVAQGMTADEPGAVSSHVTDIFIVVLDRTVPSPPQGPPSSATIAGLLNQVAQKINPTAGGTFVSPFARLSFREKVAVFQFIEGDPSMAPLKRIGGVLAFFVAFIFYSEGSAFDFATRTLKGTPAGWVASNYAGVSDGECEFKGYYQGRRQAEKSCGF